jgi:hypothetical protein
MRVLAVPELAGGGVRVLAVSAMAGVSVMIRGVGGMTGRVHGGFLRYR